MFGWRHGLDVVGGGEPGAVRLIYALSLNSWSKASMLQIDPAPSQALFRYAELLDGDASASEKFWALDKRIRADRQSLGVRVIEKGRSKLQNILTGLIIEHVISVDDLQDFSEELRESTSQWIQTYCKNLAE